MGASEKPRIVLATDSLAPSGVGEHMLTLAFALRQHHDMVLAFRDAGEGTAFLARAHKGGFATIPVENASAAMAERLRSASTTMLHVHAGVAWEGHGLGEAARMARLPTVRTEHLPYVLTDDAQRQEHLSSVDLVDRTIFVSQATHDTFRREGACGLHAVTIRNGIPVPLPARSRAETRSLLRIPDDRTVIATVARFTPQKGYEHLLAAASKVLARFRDTCFVLIGDGPGRPAMEAWAVDLGIADSVHFLGLRTDVADMLAAADLFVLPSLFEGLPLVVLEAMALGLPVVATRIGGTSEALGDDYALLAPPGDPDALAEKLAEAVEMGSARLKIGERNRRRYQQAFSADRMASETAALYRAVVAERAQAR